MDNWIGINELADRYGGKLNLKHKSIYKFGKILLLIGIVAGIMCLILFNKDWIHITFESKIVISIILNIAAQMGLFGGIAIVFFYIFWHITLQAMRGVKQTIFIVLLPILMIITCIVIPENYIPVVSDLVYKDNKALFITNDLNYVWICITDKETIESKEILLDDCTFGANEKLYGYIRFQNEKFILPYEDYLMIKDNHNLSLLCQYDYATKIVVRYELHNNEINGEYIPISNTIEYKDE